MSIQRVRSFAVAEVLLALSLAGSAGRGQPSAAPKPMLLEAYNRL